MTTWHTSIERAWNSPDTADSHRLHRRRPLVCNFGRGSHFSTTMRAAVLPIVRRSPGLSSMTTGLKRNALRMLEDETSEDNAYGPVVHRPRWSRDSLLVLICAWERLSLGTANCDCRFYSLGSTYPLQFHEAVKVTLIRPCLKLKIP